MNEGNNDLIRQKKKKIHGTDNNCKQIYYH